MTEKREGWLTVEDMNEKHMLPLNVYDANGMVIRRKITAFNPTTGEVESLILIKEGPVARYMHYMDENGIEHIKRRVETYPAPLMYKKITVEEVKYEQQRGYWDQHEEPDPELLEEHRKFQQYVANSAPKYTYSDMGPPKENITDGPNISPSRLEDEEMIDPDDPRCCLPIK